MSDSWTRGIDRITLLVGATLLATTLTHGFFSQQFELSSEIASWLLLPLLLKITHRPEVSYKTPFSNVGPRSSSSLSLWAVAAGVAVSSLYKSERGEVETLPALTPLLLLAYHHLRAEPLTSTPTVSWFFSPLVSTVWGTTIFASFAIFVLSNGEVLRLAISVVAIVALLLVNVAFVERPLDSRGLLPHINNVEAAVHSLAWRVVVLLTLVLGFQMIVLGLVRNSIVEWLFLTSAKVMSWYFTIQMAQHISWYIVPSIGTFSLLSTQNPFLQFSGLQAFLTVVASLLALGQVVYTLPQQAKAKSALWGFAVIPLLPYLANQYAIWSSQSSAQTGFIHFQKHPVEVLVDNAKANFDIMLQKQSTSYNAASTEYQRRYGMEPPPGFEAWYEFAKSHQSPIIDDYDVIYAAISPFWKMSGKEVLQAMSGVQAASGSEVWLCQFSGISSKTQCNHPHRSFDRHITMLFDKLLGQPRIKLSDVNFLVNHLDEPRVLIPLTATSSKSAIPKGHFSLMDMSHRPVWNLATGNCPPQLQAYGKKDATHSKVNTFELPFVTNYSSALDLCQHPEYKNMHGLFMSPTSFRLIQGLVPVLSTGAPSTMGDILHPSAAYIETEFVYDNIHDIDWNQKRNDLYWAGSTSGSFVVDGTWQQHHRQRFVSLAQNLQRQQHHYLQESKGVVRRITSSFLNSRLYNVFFTRVFQCERKWCRDQRAYFRTRGWADKDEALKSKLVFDLDGNGISGRYYKLLASKSCVLKQTLFREWHDDRLVPWLHYIPVSQSMEELPELVRYLTSSEKGVEKARVVAEQGRDWYTKAFREVDMSVYTYRLLLELARLQDPTREAS